MTDLQALAHFNIINDVNYSKTLYHIFMATRLQLCIDEIISGGLSSSSTDKYLLSQIIYLFQNIVENEWLITEFDQTLKPMMNILTRYVRKNLENNKEICILVDRYNSLLRLDNGS